MHMTRWTRVGRIAGFAFAVNVVATAGAAPPDRGDERGQAIRSAASRSLPVLASGATVWMEGGAPKQSSSCNSCHVVTFSVWAHRSAMRRGLVVDRTAVNQVTTWSLERPDSIDETGQLLLALLPGAAGDSEPAPRSRIEELVGRIREGRNEQGTWSAGGQLPFQKRPREETDGTTTMWALLALDVAGSPPPEAELASIAQHLDDAIGGAAAEPRSTEWLALRAWLDRRLGTGDGDDGARRRSLLAAQNEDGGWPWLLGKASDPIATGQVLYLLPRLGVPASDDAVRRAVDHLLKGQRDDGSWRALGTLERSRHEETWTSRYWGTAWATIGLLEALEAE